MKKITLNLTTLDFDIEINDIPIFYFDTVDELTHKLNSFGKYPVAICAIKILEDEKDKSLEIFVSEKYISFVDFIESYIERYCGENIEVWFFCYSSYEEAYKTALDMKETNPLCYDLTNNKKN